MTKNLVRVTLAIILMGGWTSFAREQAGFCKREELCKQRQVERRVLQDNTVFVSQGYVESKVKASKLLIIFVGIVFALWVRL